MVGLTLGSNVTNVAPIAGPWLLIWTKVTVGALKFRVRYVLLSAFDVEIVKCALNYLGACCADIEDSPYLPSGSSCRPESDKQMQPFFEGRYSKSYRGAPPSSSCFTLGIPSGHPAGSHSTTRAISSTRRFPAAIGVEGAFKQAKRPVRPCRAEQVKYARLRHRL
jgi:hypothetical protein